MYQFARAKAELQALTFFSMHSLDNLLSIDAQFDHSNIKFGEILDLSRFSARAVEV